MHETHLTRGIVGQKAPELDVPLWIDGAGNDISPILLADYQEQLKKWLESCKSEEELHRLLRRYRLQQMVKIAFADVLS